MFYKVSFEYLWYGEKKSFYILTSGRNYDEVESESLSSFLRIFEIPSDHVSISDIVVLSNQEYLTELRIMNKKNEEDVEKLLNNL